MKKLKSESLKPFISVMVIIATLFSVMFLKMEGRRLGYMVLKENRHYKELKDQQRMMVMELAHLMRPDHIRQQAISKLTLNDARNGQIIHLVGERLAVPQ